MSAMACSNVAGARGRQPGARARRGRTGRALGALGAVGVLAAVGLLSALPLVALAGSARAAGTAHGAGTQAGSGVQLTVTSVGPSYAAPGSTITVRGIVRNASGTALSGTSVQLLWSRTPFASRIDLADYALGAGGYVPPAQAPVGPAVSVGTLSAGTSGRWVIRLPAAALGVSCFGVYPLAAQLSSAAQPLASVSIPMPYWPRAHGACNLARPKPTRIAWVWPLIDVPHQGPCPGLLNNGLAASLAPGGRLATLLQVGRRYSPSARLTWAIDPALLDNAHTMTHPYLVGSAADCAGARQQRADPAATAWLRSLTETTAGQSAFVTPYADVDIASLLEHDLTTDLQHALSDGTRVAAAVLRRTTVASSQGTPGGQAQAIAWPPSGVAYSSLLEYLAAFRFGTLVLAMPPSPVSYTPGAVTSLLSGTGIRLHVLLADSQISALLGSATAASRGPGAAFTISQLYLAETAMILDQAPSIPRPILVAPPRRWNPSAALATSLLADTVNAPWLAPTSLGRLTTLPPEHVFGPSLIQAPPPSLLPPSVTRSIDRLDRQVALLESIRVTPDRRLNRAVYGIESSAWSGSAAHGARTMLACTSRYVSDQLAGLSISGVTQVTLGGRVSNGVPVTIRSTLSYPVRVRLRVQLSNSSVRLAQPPVITLRPEQIKTLKLTVHANQNGSARLKLQLTSVAGEPLRGEAYYVTIRATDFGTIVLVIGAAVLALFVIASAARAIRHGRPQAAAEGGPGPGPGAPGGPDAPGGPSGAGGADMPGGSAGPDAVDATGVAGAAGSTAGASRPGASTAGGSTAGGSTAGGDHGFRSGVRRPSERGAYASARPGEERQ